MVADNKFIATCYELSRENWIKQFSTKVDERSSSSILI